jgi:hypothetical protein
MSNKHYERSELTWRAKGRQHSAEWLDHPFERIDTH